jgi:hypothetical protein
MLSVHGERIVRRRAGFVGDFCPFCRELRPLEAFAVRRVPHLNYIQMGRGTHVATELVCQSCNSLRGIAKDATQPTKRPSTDLAELVASTNSKAMDSILARTELEDRLRSGSITADERIHLLNEPFEMLEYSAHARSLPDGAAAATLWMAVLSIVLLVVVWDGMNAFIASGYASWGRAAGAFASALAAIYVGNMCIRGVIDHAKRYRRCAAYRPALVRSLAVLQPTTQELESTLSMLRSQSSRVVASITPDQLRTLITQYHHEHERSTS